MDRYAKAVLTVIAAALVIIAARLTITSAGAVVGQCGAYQNDPCAVYLVYLDRYNDWQTCVDKEAKDDC
jgi:hypothetical protein